mmetsp:Transcript_9222/g.20077  ORF Transcript_9222/g.20077 Transcript_9222/m.20077 type:complete len:401 (+) Transcript_9222:50-1252(+)|eukprot:CAMPEP_0204332252 /NCGR_PEP_ID=MMETSP0469-20131031/16321_1 /ASSEMBLY_ACC=CAM_ASM_000384 /TAXON_ID=2969 /ORGANISM="Oxyrrhis marina" /LENGTH=400 /DNA_ID=CAMNT_0051315371 /DNA_START=31 /DNA_END=1233 /DNA_ORIENTATION=-
MGKPTNVDAQRILAIMDELKEKLTYLSVITAPVWEGLQSEEGQSTLDLLGPEIQKKFQEQIRLEELYVYSTSAGGDGQVHVDLENEDVKETVEKLEKNTRDICRALRKLHEDKRQANVSIITELRNFQIEKPDKLLKLLGGLRDMQEVMLKRLTTTVEEEQSREELLRHYMQRSDQANKKMGQLEKDLAHIRREREKTKQTTTEVINKLKADLSDIEHSTSQKMDELRRKYESRENDYRERFQKTESEIKTRIGKLQEQFTKRRSTSKDDEDELQKKMKRWEKSVLDVISEYDTLIMKLDVERAENQSGFSDEQEQLKQLQHHFEKVDAEIARVNLEEKIGSVDPKVESKRRKKLEAIKEQKNASACVLQAFWRALRVREDYLKLVKAKRKKKGKKGKKK